MHSTKLQTISRIYNTFKKFSMLSTQCFKSFPPLKRQITPFQSVSLQLHLRIANHDATNLQRRYTAIILVAENECQKESSGTQLSNRLLWLVQAPHIMAATINLTESYQAGHSFCGRRTDGLTEGTF